MKISGEAVEAAMRSIYSKPGIVTESDVRAALAAAAPHMLAQAWDEGYTMSEIDSPFEPDTPNPYR